MHCFNSLRSLLSASFLLPLSAGAYVIQRADQSENTTFIDRYVQGGTNQRMAWHGVAKLNDYLYIEGGQLSTWIDSKKTDDQDSLEFNRTLSIPLNKSWKPESVEITEISYKRNMRATNYVGLWADQKRSAIYKWAGELSRTKSYAKGQEIELYMLSAQGSGSGTWSIKEPANEATFNNIIPSTHGQSAFCNDLGFYIGGYYYDGTYYGTSAPSPGVRMYNSSSSEWSNTTKFDSNGPQGDVRDGMAVCIEGFGNSPLVMVLGGSTDREAGYQSFTSVTLYDPIKQKWYRQDTFKDSANGFPEDRAYSCAAGTQGKNGTFELYMFGGWSSGGKTLDDIWALSLPAFKWFRLTGPPTGTAARHAHKCVIAGKRQFLSIGGLRDKSPKGFQKDDTWPRGIGIFDLVTGEWASSYDPNLGDYDSPNRVQEVYKSGEADDYNYTPDIQELFWKNRKSNGTSENGQSQSSTGKTSAGTIAGATIGGVVFVALVTGGIFWFLRRRRQQSNQNTPLPTQDAKEGGQEPNVWGGQPLPPYRQEFSEPGVPIMELDSRTMSEMDCHRSPPNGTEGLAELATPELGSSLSPRM